MYRIFIADDNELTRQALKKSIPWEALQCEFCGEAANGTEALKLIADKRPDIVLMDIKMPGMTGMEVIDALRRQGMESLCIMITAYDDFAYMRKGMQMGVFDYILKPVGDKELCGVLKKAIGSLKEREREERMARDYKARSEQYRAQLQEANEALEAKFLADAVNGSKESAEKFAKLFQEKLRLHDYMLLLAVPAKDGDKSIDDFVLKQGDILTEGNHLYLVQMKGVWTKEGYLIFLGFKQAMFSREYALQSLRVAEFICNRNAVAGWEVYVALSHVSSSLEELEQLFGQTLFCKNSRFFLENRRIIHYDSLRSKSVSSEYLKMRRLEELYDACREHPSSVKDCMADFLGQFSADEIYDIDYVKNILIQAAIMMAYICRESSLIETDVTDAEAAVRELSEMDSLQNAFRWMMEFAGRIEEGSGIRGKISPITKKIVDYLNAHYAQQLALQDVADSIGISGTHVSRLIKNDIGETFITLLNKIRIRESIRLLKTGDYKVYEIAEMVGYSNYAYFYQTFKKHTGVSPKDYV